jgi:hypothetical protein
MTDSISIQPNMINHCLATKLNLHRKALKLPPLQFLMPRDVHVSHFSLKIEAEILFQNLRFTMCIVAYIYTGLLEAQKETV